jgi:UDP-N-acetylmuramyl pentapeptide phosphotransferase/UDP-N-acetylglucosamine-1-phosphate transferase
MGQSSGSMHGEVPYEYLALLVGSMMLFLVGLADDLIGVGYKKKFLVQILAASLLVASGVWIKSLDGLFGVYQVSPWFGMPFTVLIVVYVTNAINLIDGIDGLASGLCAISLVALAGLHIWLGLYSYALLCISALGVIIPFWYYNVFGNEMRGRKLFMGDSGSLSLGYIISFLMIHLSTVDVHPRAVSDYNMVLAFTTMLVPLLDVVRVVGHRLRTRKNPFLPDKNHFHHKLLRTGMRVRMVMVTIICVSVFFIALNIVLDNHLNVNCILFLNLSLWTVLHLVIDWLIARNRQKRESAFDKRF